MTPLTLYLSRLLGVFLLIIAVAEATQRSILAETLLGIADTPALLLVAGMITAVAGLAIVLAHNVWRGGTAAVVVTILGWLLLLKGAVLIVLPPAFWADIILTSRFTQLYPAYAILPVVLGGYLTFSGFWANHRGGSKNVI